MPSSQKTISVNSVSVALLWPANKRRSYVTIQNQSTLDIIINIGGTPSDANGLVIPPGEEWSPVNPPKGDIRVIGIAATGAFQKLFSAEESL